MRTRFTPTLTACEASEAGAAVAPRAFGSSFRDFPPFERARTRLHRPFVKSRANVCLVGERRIPGGSRRNRQASPWRGARGRRGSRGGGQRRLLPHVEAGVRPFGTGGTSGRRGRSPPRSVLRRAKPDR